MRVHMQATGKALGQQLAAKAKRLHGQMQAIRACAECNPAIREWFAAASNRASLRSTQISDPHTTSHGSALASSDASASSSSRSLPCLPVDSSILGSFQAHLRTSPGNSSNRSKPDEAAAARHCACLDMNQAGNCLCSCCPPYGLPFSCHQRSAMAAGTTRSRPEIEVGAPIRPTKRRGAGMNACYRIAWLGLGVVASIVVPMRLMEIVEANQVRYAPEADALTVTTRK